MSIFATKSFVEGGNAFPGEVVMVEKEHSIAFGKESDQYHLGIRPLTFTVKNSGMFHEYLTVTNRKGSKTYQFALALEAIKVQVNQPEDLKGKKFLWERRTVTLYKDKEGVNKDVEMLVPVKALTDAEAEAEVAKYRANVGTTGGSTGSTGSATSPIAPAEEIEPHHLGAILDLIDGKTKTEAIVAIGRSTELPKNVKNAYSTGAVVKQLKALELVKEEDGKYLKV